MVSDAVVPVEVIPAIPAATQELSPLKKVVLEAVPVADNSDIPTASAPISAATTVPSAISEVPTAPATIFAAVTASSLMIPVVILSNAFLFLYLFIIFIHLGNTVFVTSNVLRVYLPYIFQHSFHQIVTSLHNDMQNPCHKLFFDHR